MLSIKYTGYFLGILLFITSCQHKKTITLATNLEGTLWHENGKVLAAEMAEYGWNIEVLSGPDYSPDKNFSLVQNNQVDFAFVANSNLHSEKNIQTVLALNTEVLLVVQKNDTEKKYTSLNELVAGKKVLLPFKNSEASNIILKIFKMLDIGPEQYTPVYVDPKNIDFKSKKWLILVDSVDVFIHFSELNNPKVKELLKHGWQLFSSAKVENFLQGSLTDAFCYKYPWAFPVLVPRGIFGRRQPNKINTIGIKSLLVTNAQTDPMLVYDFIRDYYQALPIISKSRVTFAESRNLDKNSLLSFPLHAGAIRYRDRDKPKFAERYAELIALMVTLSVVGSGLIAQYIRRVKQIKKDKIDVYYDRLLNARNTEDLDKIRNQAISQLQSENLSADNSFLIFLILYEELKTEFQEQAGANAP